MIFVEFVISQWQLISFDYYELFLLQLHTSEESFNTRSNYHLMNFWCRFFQYFKTNCDKVGNGYLFDGEQVTSTLGFRTITWVPYILCSPRFYVIPLWEDNIPNKLRINSSMVSEVTMAQVSTIVSHYFRQVNISLNCCKSNYYVIEF